MASLHRVVIIGGGFAGLTLALALKRVSVQITLLDRRNHHLFQPLLYQVATGGLSPANIASPLRVVLRRQRNARFLLGEATGIDLPGHRVLLKDGDIPYDTLVVATGAQDQYFNHPEWEVVAPGLKTIEDATRIRRQILSAFEAAERESDPEKRKQLLTFLIVGAGPTGVELAGTIAELSRHTMRNDFRSINPADAQIILLEGGDRALATFPQALSDRTKQALTHLGVVLRTGVFVTDIRPDGVTLKVGDAVEKLPAATVLWAAGVKASPLGAILARSAGSMVDRSGRVHVNVDLTLPGHPDVFVIGDVAMVPHMGGKPLPGVAPVAMQEGTYVANLIRARLKGQTQPPFRYKDKGNMATIGRGRAVADLHWIWLWGHLAWMAWLFIHLLYIVTFENRMLVLFQWGWNFVTRNRSALLITNEPHLPPESEQRSK